MSKEQFNSTAISVLCKVLKHNQTRDNKLSFDLHTVKSGNHMITIHDREAGKMITSTMNYDGDLCEKYIDNLLREAEAI